MKHGNNRTEARCHKWQSTYIRIIQQDFKKSPLSLTQGQSVHHSVLGTQNCQSHFDV